MGSLPLLLLLLDLGFGIAMAYQVDTDNTTRDILQGLGLTRLPDMVKVGSEWSIGGLLEAYNWLQQLLARALGEENNTPWSRDSNRPIALNNRAVTPHASYYCVARSLSSHCIHAFDSYLG